MRPRPLQEPRPIVLGRNSVGYVPGAMNKTEAAKLAGVKRSLGRINAMLTQLKPLTDVARAEMRRLIGSSVKALNGLLQEAK